MHKPISLHNISLWFGNKPCIIDFNTQIHFGSRIAIMGRNGGGKSSLLKLLMDVLEPTAGELSVPHDVRFGYVPQVIEDFDALSGGERFNKKLSAALASSPNVLLLDEPTNHLDAKNRNGLLRKLDSFYGTLIVVTHDIEVLRNCVDIIWHIDNGKIIEFTGKYDDYLHERTRKRFVVEKNLALLKREKKDTHACLMKEQDRAAKSKAKGQKNILQKKYPTVKSLAKASRSEQTSGKKKASIEQKKAALTEKLALLQAPAVIIPKFELSASVKSRGILVSITHGGICYPSHEPLLNNINITLSSMDKVAITGDNGCGKTTLIKAILNSTRVIKTGEWVIPDKKDIGYLDQHYANIEPDKSILDSFSEAVPLWSITEIRRFLNDFLFENDNVHTLGKNLSGGERARFCLAQIAAHPPKLLLLDEITNNLDLETKEHVGQILQDYPGALLVISHDQEFMGRINIGTRYEISNGSAICRS